MSNKPPARPRTAAERELLKVLIAIVSRLVHPNAPPPPSPPHRPGR